MHLTLSDLTTLVEGKVLSGDCPRITGFETLEEAGPTELSFYANDKYLAQLRSTRAGAVLVAKGLKESITQSAVIEVDNPSEALARVVTFFHPRPQFVAGIHPSAIIHPSVQYDPNEVFIGPLAILEEGVSVGPQSYIGGGAYLGANVKLGAHCKLHPHATVLAGCILGDRVTLHSGTVIGADGYGYEFVNGRHLKIDQIGIVEIGDDVEIGANSTIDRARFGRTKIGEGTKIDNQVQIGHNCVVGKHSIIIAQTGIAGSTRIGDFAVIAAQVGIAGHLDIANQVVLAARSGVTKSIRQSGQYMGFPAQPAKQARKAMVCTRRLPEIFERLKNLENKASIVTP